MCAYKSIIILFYYILFYYYIVIILLYTVHRDNGWRENVTILYDTWCILPIDIVILCDQLMCKCIGIEYPIRNLCILIARTHAPTVLIYAIFNQARSLEFLNFLEYQGINYIADNPLAQLMMAMWWPKSILCGFLLDYK